MHSAHRLHCYHLDYFSSKFHFGGHYVAMTGYDEQNAYLVDTIPQGTNSKTSLAVTPFARPLLKSDQLTP